MIRERREFPRRGPNFFPHFIKLSASHVRNRTEARKFLGEIKEKSEYPPRSSVDHHHHIHRAKHSMPKKPVDASPRRWGTRFDSLLPMSPSIPQTELSSSSAATPQSAHQSARPGRGDLPKLPHQASVFVGSLPSAMDHRELIRALYDHLSPYAEIHNIKVVRDSYHGGVCAFVQCQVSISPQALPSRSLTLR